MVVGWYTNATVYSGWQDSPKKAKRRVPRGKANCGYYIKADASNATLLDKDERLLQVPRGKGGLGESNVWFAQTASGRKFLDLVSVLIANGPSVFARRHRQRARHHGDRQPNHADRTKVEQAAIEMVETWYLSRGYFVSTVSKDNLGWDLEATLGTGTVKSVLKIEVKGLSGNSVCVELTPNEYAKMKSNTDTYRLCVVTNALNKRRQNMHRFGRSIDTGKWEDQFGNILRIQNVVAARCSV